MSRRLRIGVPIERHAELIYTRSMHERFYNELYESGAFVIVDKAANNMRFTIIHNKEINWATRRKNLQHPHKWYREHQL